MTNEDRTAGQERPVFARKRLKCIAGHQSYGFVSFDAEDGGRVHIPYHLVMQLWNSEHDRLVTPLQPESAKETES